MGEFMKEDDSYIGLLLDLLNLRFAPGEAIAEIAELQKKFQIFANNRSFKDSVRVLNLAGSDREARKKWFKLLEWLAKCKSDTEQNGNDRIVSALIKNLTSEKPSPVFFTGHDGRENERVLVKECDRPVFYMHETFLTISLPLKPR